MTGTACSPGLPETSGIVVAGTNRSPLPEAAGFPTSCLVGLPCWNRAPGLTPFINGWKEAACAAVRSPQLAACEALYKLRVPLSRERFSRDTGPAFCPAIGNWEVTGALPAASRMPSGVLWPPELPEGPCSNGTIVTDGAAVCFPDTCGVLDREFPTGKDPTLEGTCLEPTRPGKALPNLGIVGLPPVLEETAGCSPLGWSWEDRDPPRIGWASALVRV